MIMTPGSFPFRFLVPISEMSLDISYSPWELIVEAEIGIPHDLQYDMGGRHMGRELWYIGIL